MPMLLTVALLSSSMAVAATPYRPLARTEISYTIGTSAFAGSKTGDQQADHTILAEQKTSPPPGPFPDPPAQSAAGSVPLSPTNDKSRRPTPLGRPGSWATPNDYPTAALRSNVEGITRFTLDIAKDGTVSKCDVTGSSGNAELDDATCQLILKRASFQPALDAKGNATEGKWHSAVRWVIPRRNPLNEPQIPPGYAFPYSPRISGVSSPIPKEFYPKEALESGEEGLRFIEVEVSPAGEISKCGASTLVRPNTPYKSGLLVEASCEYLRKTAKFKPAVDFDGIPTEGRVHLPMTWINPNGNGSNSAANGRVEPSGASGTTFQNWLETMYADGGKFLVRAKLDANGQMKECKILLFKNGPVGRQAQTPLEHDCPSEMQLPRSPPLLDKQGKPVARSVEVTVVTKPIAEEPSK